VATLPTCFKTALSTIEPGADATNAKHAHAAVSKALKADCWFQDLGIDPVLIGSYAREVGIRRVKDVDVFARLKRAGSDLLPGRVLDELERVLVAAFGRGRVERQQRSLKVEFPDYHLSVDVVPARPCGDHWEIPNRPEHAARARWVETNPTRLTELTTDMNKTYLLNGSGIYVPVVKLVRQVRRTWIDDQPGGLYYEILTYWAFRKARPNETSVANYLEVVLTTIKDLFPNVIADGLDDPTLTTKKITTKATDEQLRTAAARTREAAELARDALGEVDDCRAADMWRRLLGQTSDGQTVFPVPSYCASAGGRSRTASLTPGAPRVPAGRDRYA
jgi:hypothetical protein